MEKCDMDKIERFIIPKEDFEIFKACWHDHDILEANKKQLRSDLEIARLRLQNLSLQAQNIKLSEQIMKMEENRIKKEINETDKQIKNVKIKSTEVGKKIYKEYGIDTSKGVIDENTGEWKSEGLVEREVNEV